MIFFIKFSTFSVFCYKTKAAMKTFSMLSETGWGGWGEGVVKLIEVWDRSRGCEILPLGS